MADLRRPSVLPRALAASLTALGPAGCFNPDGNAGTDDSTASTTPTTSTTSTTSTTRESTTTEGATTTDATHTSDPTGPMTTVSAATTDHTSTGSTDATASTTAPAVCGDGKLDDGEECDDGNQNDTDLCPSTCKTAVCGDDFILTGTEECDDGNLDDNDACPSTCKTAFCGDGFTLDGTEECDGNQTDACTANCTRERYIFVTPTTQLGNLGGTAGADALCVESAMKGVMPVKMKATNFIAWLSVDNDPIITRLGSPKGPYRLPKGSPVATSISELLNGELSVPIDQDAAGNTIVPVTLDCTAMGTALDGFAWTGTISGGLHGSEDCAGWASGAMNTKGIAGEITAISSKWTDACPMFVPCDKQLRLYCLEKE